MTRVFSNFVLAAVLTFAVSSVGHAQLTTLWQIGRFDHSSQEFRGDFRTDSTVLYRVGQSHWETDWPPFHPGSANGAAGGRGHPYTVVFSLTKPPRGIYTLTLAVLCDMPRRPNLQVEINGKHGLFYLHPQLSYDLGEPQAAFIPQHSAEQLEIKIPTDYLKEGKNQLVLTCVDDPPEPENSYGAVGEGISGIYYDALRLSQDVSKTFSSDDIHAVVTPTIFYRQKGSRLVETLDALIRLNRNISGGEAVLDLNGHSYSSSLSPARDFGEQQVEFEVSEWAGSVKARLQVRAGGTRELTLLSSLRGSGRYSWFPTPTWTSAIPTTKVRLQRRRRVSWTRRPNSSGKTRPSGSRWTHPGT